VEYFSPQIFRLSTICYSDKQQVNCITKLTYLLWCFLWWWWCLCLVGSSFLGSSLIFTSLESLLFSSLCSRRKSNEEAKEGGVDFSPTAKFPNNDLASFWGVLEDWELLSNGEILSRLLLPVLIFSDFSVLSNLSSLSKLLGLERSPCFFSSCLCFAFARTLLYAKVHNQHRVFPSTCNVKTSAIYFKENDYF